MSAEALDPSWPRVTGGYDGGPGVIYNSGLIVASEWMSDPKWLLRGRLCHAGAHLIAQGITISEAWFQRASGTDYRDPFTQQNILGRVEHEQCRPYLIGVSNALKENAIKVVSWELLVRHRFWKYYGHLDWLGTVNGRPSIIDLKCGIPAPWHKVQTALYCAAKMSEERPPVPYDRYALYLGLQHNAKAYRLIQHTDQRDFTAAQIFAQAFHLKRQYLNVGNTNSPIAA